MLLQTFIKLLLFTKGKVVKIPEKRDKDPLQKLSTQDFFIFMGPVLSLVDFLICLNGIVGKRIDKYVIVENKYIGVYRRG